MKPFISRDCCSQLQLLSYIFMREVAQAILRATAAVLGPRPFIGRPIGKGQLLASGDILPRKESHAWEKRSQVPHRDKLQVPAIAAAGHSVGRASRLLSGWGTMGCHHRLTRFAQHSQSWSVAE